MSTVTVSDFLVSEEVLKVTMTQLPDLGGGTRIKFKARFNDIDFYRMYHGPMGSIKGVGKTVNKLLRDISQYIESGKLPELANEEKENSS